MNKNVIFVSLLIAVIFCTLPIWSDGQGGNMSILERLLKIENELVPPVGSILPYYGNGENPPKGWLFCKGQPVPSGSEYNNLRNLVGTNVPDLRGRVPMGAGKGDELSNRTLGEKIGCETQASNVTVSKQPSFNVPAHYHGNGNLNITASGNHDHLRITPPLIDFALSNGFPPHKWLRVFERPEGPGSVSISMELYLRNDPAKHTHDASSFSGNVGNLSGSNGDGNIDAPRTADVVLSNAPVNNMQPSLVVNFIIKY